MVGREDLEYFSGGRTLEDRPLRVNRLQMQILFIYLIKVIRVTEVIWTYWCKHKPADANT